MVASSSRPPSIRPLRAADAGIVSILHGEAFRRGWSAPEVEAMILDPAVLAQGVRRNPSWPASCFRRAGDLDGFVLSRRVLDEAEVLTIAVAARAQGAGLGRALLQDHMGRLAALGVRRLFLEVDEGNVPARALYAGSGFEEVGRRDAYYRKADGSAATALVLACPLG
ncbi:MAG: GNAT family N-acetyltransferase [Alsobacter sp.]